LASPQPLFIDVVSDVVCPWCFLGKKSLDRALENVPDIPVAVRWRPFQLDPTIPPGGLDRQVYMRRKFGSTERLEAAHRTLEERGKAVGIDYAFDRIKRSPNTLDAHRLVRWAGEAEHQDAVVERLFRGYFSDGEDIGDHAALARLAAEAGMDERSVAERLAGDGDRIEVEGEIAQAGQAGITGVPCFIFAGRYAVSGAQPVETLADVIRQVAAKTAEN
jgi:predicted DsbA family dithiol-disulfide isomerase